MPANSLAAAAQTIGRKNLEAELQSLQKRYADGLISNDDMKKALSESINSPLLSSSEKVQMEDTLRSLDLKIRTSKLEAAYKSAPDNSPQKIQSAQALANYYAQYAGELIPDTPAHSEAIQKSAEWSNVAVSEQSQVEKSQRALLRAQKLNELAQVPDGSIEELNKKIEVYRALANNARADGAETEALNYDTQAQNALNSIPQLQLSMNKKQVKDVLNNLNSQLASGQINAQQMNESLQALAPTVDDIGDSALSLSFTKLVESVTKKAGSERQASLTNGWDKSDLNYSDEVRQAQEALQGGEIDVNQYSQLLQGSLERRNTDLENRYTSIYEMVQNDPNARVKVNGRLVRGEDLLNTLDEDRRDLGTQIDAINSGSFGIMAVPPDQFNQSGTLKKSGKSQVTYKFFDTRNKPAGIDYAQDETGVYYPVTRKPVEVPYEEYQVGSMEKPAEYSMDKNTGKYFKLSQPQVEVYRPGTADRVVQPFVPNQTVAPYNKPPAQFNGIVELPGLKVDDQPGLSVQKWQNVEAKPSPAPTQSPIIAPTPTKTVAPTPTPTPLPAATPKPQTLATQVAPQPQKNIIQSGFDWLKSGIKNLSTKIFGR